MFTEKEFTCIAKKYMDTVYRTAYSWLKNADDANDITQDVMIELYKTDKDFESESHIKNWRIRVTVNKCKSLFRSPARKTDDIEDYAEELSFEEPDCRYLFEAVMKLDKKYRVPLMLFYYEGYSTAEVADILHLPQRTVSTRLFRAKAKLRAYLEED